MTDLSGHALTGYKPYSYTDDPDVPSLPDDKIVLVMDGNCALCSWGARTIAANDPGDYFRITTVTSKTGQALLKHYGLSPDDPWSWLVIDQGYALTSSEAICHVIRKMHWSRAWLGHIGLVLPRPWREAAYRYVAARRIKWFGKDEMCDMPSEPLRVRLLDN